MHVGLLDHRCQRLLDGAPTLEKRRKIGSGAQARDAQHDAARPRLPSTYTPTDRDSRSAAPGGRATSRDSRHRSSRGPTTPSLLKPKPPECQVKRGQDQAQQPDPTEKSHGHHQLHHASGRHRRESRGLKGTHKVIHIDVRRLDGSDALRALRCSCREGIGCLRDLRKEPRTVCLTNIVPALTPRICQPAMHLETSEGE